MQGLSRVLFLQGPLGPLYGFVADHLASNGVTVFRVNFSGNDVADWAHREAIPFRGRLSEWMDFLDSRIQPLGIDAILMHGDRRPYHRIAAAWAARRGIDVFVTELGYLRPDWMTLEREGTSTLSRFPTEPGHVLAIAARSANVDFRPEWRDSALPLIFGEVRFTVFNTLMWLRFPYYQSHRAVSAWRVYSGWLAGRARQTRWRRRPAALPEAPYYVFALQLEGDLQLRDHSPFASVAETVEHVALSFVRHAPEASILVLKPHPHEFLRKRLLAAVAAVRRRHGLGARLEVREDQSVVSLCENAKGFVTVNSSAGIEALSAGCPVCTVLPTIYDIEGLTHRGHLDTFWTDATSPDPGLFEALRRALAGTIQVRGTLYHPDGCRHAARDMALRLLSGDVNMPDAFEDAPPRLAKAAAMGVRYGDLPHYQARPPVGPGA